MTVVRLPEHVYHLAERENWPRIRREGLLPAAELLARVGRSATAHRPGHVVLDDGVQVRDQKPMPPAALRRCLVGMTPQEWYAAVNARVFFWCDRSRLERHRAAFPDRAQVLLVLDTRALVAAHRDRVALTPFNVGNARRRATARNLATFVTLPEWERTGWASEAAVRGAGPRPASHRPAELTVLGGVPDPLRFVVETHELDLLHNLAVGG